MGIYMHKFLRSIYIASRERLKQKELELEDIKLQVLIFLFWFMVYYKKVKKIIKRLFFRFK